MKLDSYAILPEDELQLNNRISELELAIVNLGPRFRDVFTQSSETWHDNAPFDALREHQSVLDAELQGLRLIRSKATVVKPHKKEKGVGIGSTVTVRNTKNNRESTYYIAGDWTPHAGQARDEVMKISRQAPLAQAMIGKSVDETFELHAPYVVVKITP